VVWIDAAIVINPLSPAIGPGAPLEKIGAVDEHTYPIAGARQLIIKIQIEGPGIKALIEGTRGVHTRIAENWATVFDPADCTHSPAFRDAGQRIIQTGVLVLSTRRQHLARTLAQGSPEACDVQMGLLYIERWLTGRNQPDSRESVPALRI
jgi:hypothetical protein